MELLKRGIYAPIVTPYDERGQINREVTGELTRYIVDNGVDGILVCGSTGEFPLLDTNERKVMAETVSASSGKASVMINVSSMLFHETIDLIKHATGINADAVSVVTPYYYGFNDTALFAYFSEICKAAEGIPVYLYNIPGNTHNPISSSLIMRLLENFDNLVGIKDSSMDFMVLLDYLTNLSPEFQIITGNDAQVLYAIEAGATGAIVASAGIVPGIAKGIFTDYQNGNWTSAHEKQLVLHKLRDLFRSLMPVVSHKRALEHIGFPMGKLRSPFRPLTQSEDNKLRENLELLNCIRSV